MVGGSSSLRRGVVPPLYQRSWSLARRMRAARRDTAQLVAPALTAVRARLTRPSMSWTQWVRGTEAQHTSNTSPTRPSRPRSSSGGKWSNTRSRSPSRDKSKSVKTRDKSKSGRSWAGVRSAHIGDWAQRSRTELTYLSKRFRRAAGVSSPQNLSGPSEKSQENGQARPSSSVSGNSEADVGEAIEHTAGLEDTAGETQPDNDTTTRVFAYMFPSSFYSFLNLLLTNVSIVSVY